VNDDAGTTSTSVVPVVFRWKARMINQDTAGPKTRPTPANAMLPELRDWLKGFALNHADPRLLRWQPAWERVTGENVRVALLDGGIATRHSTFEGADIHFHAPAGSFSRPDPTWHGTKSATLLVGQGRRWPRGVIPDAKLLYAQVRPTPSGMQAETVLAQALQWAAKAQAHIIILPIGRVFPSQLVAKTLRKILASGIQVFAAAGNQGPDTLLFPASVSGVIAVSGAAYDGQPLGWCCQSDKVACLAPGEPLAFGLGHSTLSGSSLATVLAGGAAALQLAAERAAVSSTVTP
jgi:subtilisin family serine protease